MADLESDIVGNATKLDGECDGLVSILENEVISREVLKYLNLADLQACTLVCQSTSYIAKCLIRDHFIMNANLPLKSSPCTALAALECALDQMDVIQFTGLHIHINACSAHPAASPLIQMANDLYPSILNRLTLNRLIVKFTASTERMCWMGTKLIEILLDKNATTLKELSLDLTGSPSGRDLLKFIHGGRVFTKLSKLTLNGCYLYKKGDDVLRKSFYSSFPNLEEISSQDLSSIPREQFRFIKHLIVTDNNWWDAGGLSRMGGDNLKLDFLNVITTNLKRCYFGNWKERYGKEMQYLMQRSCDSLRTLIIQGQDEFPQFSQLNIPPMTNLRNLQIVCTMDDKRFLPELANLCAMLPVLHSVHIYHSPCRAIHSGVEELEDEFVIVPNASASILKVQGLDVKMDTLMPILAKCFPNLKQFQVYDCHSSALEYISLWPQLKCLALGATTSYWNDNFDQVLIGFTEDEMHRWVAGGNADAEIYSNSLMALKNLMRLYLTGGGQRSEEDSSVLLSPLAMSCLLKNFPNLDLRILPGCNESVLSHLAPFENSHESLWCPSHPFDIESLFYP